VRDDGRVVVTVAAGAAVVAGVWRTVQPSPATTTSTRPALEVSPLLGLTVLVLAIALFFLVRSMRRQIKKIDFDETGLTDEERARRRQPPNPPAPA
jgi:hypothetical protein